MVPADPGSTVWKAMIFDVTDQVQARAERELLIDQMPAAVMRIDVNRQTLLYASPQVEALTGEPPESWIGEAGYARWAEQDRRRRCSRTGRSSAAAARPGATSTAGCGRTASSASSGR